MELTLQVCLNAIALSVTRHTYLEGDHLVSSYMNVLREQVSVILMLMVLTILVVITVPV